LSLYDGVAILSRGFLLFFFGNLVAPTWTSVRTTLSHRYHAYTINRSPATRLFHAARVPNPEERKEYGESRLGRGVRGLSGANGGAALSPPVQQSHRRRGHRRHGRRLRAGRGPRADRTDVLRLSGPRRRRDLQPACQVAGDVRGAAEDAGRAAGVGGQQVRGPAQPGLDGAVRAHSGPQGRLPRHALRRQGADVRRLDRNRSGRLLREPAPLRSAGTVSWH